jgi:hypothetical protein
MRFEAIAELRGGARATSRNAEMSGLAAMWRHLLMGALLVSRLLHPFGM